ncbi:MAG: hypothetical protein A2889_04775 [Nitrospinae bacterium RIFCSPLOWO2_01_FULL_39_10]|nr:MAG: hypothetical protein A2889_04775 [Nitrospinae bacterium RIFCSPLOWO2_01_FULL_39_10]
MLKKTIILLTVLSLIAVAGSGCARWWYKHYDAEWIVKKIDKRINGLNLNLTDEQKGKLDAVKGKIVEHINLRKDSREKMLKLFNEESVKDTPSIDGLVGAFKENNARRSKDMDEIADRLYEFYLSLDTAQKKKVAEAFKEKVVKCERWIR